MAAEDKSDDVYLRIISGPAAGQEFPLKGAEFTVGRTESASIMIPDILISRNHARIFLDGESWKIEDLSSANGTWILGNQINEIMPLHMKTAVRVGDSLFEILRPQEAELDTSFISYRVQPITMESLTSDKTSLVVHRQASQEQRKLAAIYTLQSLLATIEDDTELYDQILETITDVIPADRTYLLRYIPDQDSLLPAAERDANSRVKVISDTFLSKSIISYVKESNEAILSNDALNDERFHGDSLSGYDVHSIICAPMHGKQQFCGLIYMMVTQVAHKFTEDDLKLLATVAHSAGMAIENRDLVERNIAAERMAAIGLAAASLSHYVKNILTSLEGSVSLLRMGIDATDGKLMNEAWDILSKNHKRLSTLVLDLLNLAKEDSVELGVYNLSDVVIEAVKLVRPAAAKDKIDIELNDQIYDEPIYAEIDSRGLHRVLLNLLNNALDAVRTRHKDSDEGGIKIDVRREKQGESVIIEVSDNGIGIPEQNLDKIFELFHTDKGETGTGLGLAVSKRIIEGHLGTITVGSEVGVGSMFTIKVPTRHHMTNTSVIDLKTFF